MDNLGFAPIGLLLAAAMSVTNVLTDVWRKRALDKRDLFPVTFWLRVAVAAIFAIVLAVQILRGQEIVIRDAGLLFDCARGRFERLELRQPVLAMRLVASELPPFVPAGRDLFDTRPVNAVPLEQLRERLRARLGEQAIQQLHRTVDPRPEKAQSDASHVKAATSPETLPSLMP